MTATEGPRGEQSDARDAGGRSALGLWFRRAFVLLGLVLVGAALVVLFRPTLLPLSERALPTVTEELRDQLLVVLAGAALTGGLAIYAVRHMLGIHATGTPSRSEEPIPYPPEQVYTTPSTLAGRAFDTRLDAHDPGADESETVPHEVRETLRETAIALLTTGGAHDRQEAREQVETGAWTDDPRAAACIGTDAPDLHWRTALYDWVRPEPRHVCRVRHTVAALEAYREAHETDGSQRATAAADGEAGDGREVGT